MTDQPYADSPGLADLQAGGPASNAGRARDQDDKAGLTAKQLREDAAHISDQAAQVAGAAKRRTLEAMEQQRLAGADRMGNFARTTHKAADRIGEDMPLAADYVHDAARRIERLSDTLRDRSIDQLIGDVETFARTQPIALFGASIAAGFAISRFLKSTARRSDPAAGGEARGGGRQ
jgi:hypothetical protein